MRATCPLLPLLITALLLSVACGKPGKEEPLSSEVTDFNVLYSNNCAGCHGPDGKNGAAQPLHNALYLALIPKDKLRQVTESGIAGTLMPAFALSQGGPLTPKQVDILINQMEQRWAHPASLPASPLPAYSQTGGDPARGQQVFQTACASCHTGAGKGGLLTSQTFLGLASNQSLRTSTIVGRAELGMPDWRNVVPGRALTDPELADVVAYLSSSRLTSASSTLPPTAGRPASALAQPATSAAAQSTAEENK